MTVEQRFSRFVDETPGSCWEWTGTKNARGYGQMRVDGKMVGAHRVSFQLYVGPIPADLTVDHLCRNIGCVNPQHLELVTMRENILRGDCPPAVNARKTHCVRGHALSGENLYVSPKGRRRCQTCERAKSARRWQRTKAAR